MVRPYATFDSTMEWFIRASYQMELPSSPCVGATSCHSLLETSTKFSRPKRIERLWNVELGSSSMIGLPNNALERTVKHRGPRLAAARSSWPAAQLGR